MVRVQTVCRAPVLPLLLLVSIAVLHSPSGVSATPIPYYHGLPSVSSAPWVATGTSTFPAPQSAVDPAYGQYHGYNQGTAYGRPNWYTRLKQRLSSWRRYWFNDRTEPYWDAATEYVQFVPVLPRAESIHN